MIPHISKQINEKRKLFFTIEFQQVNVEGMIE